MELTKLQRAAGLFFFLFFATSILHAEQKATTHSGVWDGERCTVTIEWDDYSGNDEIRGKIQFKNGGNILTFSGDNPRSGFMEIDIEGEPVLYKLTKAKNGSVVTWTGGPGDGLSFTRDSAQGNRASGGTGGRASGGRGSGGTMNPQSDKWKEVYYEGYFRGKYCHVTINWEDYDGLGKIAGQFIVDGEVIRITGSNTRKGHIEFRMQGEVHKLNKEIRNNKVSWVGAYTSFTKSDGKSNTPPSRGGNMNNNGGRVPSSAPPVRTGNSGKQNPIGESAPNDGTWVIACEAEKSKADAVTAASRWRKRNFDADILWIPDYHTLSGAKLWLVYVGPFAWDDKDLVRHVLEKGVRGYYKDAYGILLDSNGKRETIE